MSYDTNMLDITGSSVGDLFKSVVEGGLQVWRQIEENEALNERLGLELQLRQLDDNQRAEEVAQPVFAPGITTGAGFAGMNMTTMLFIGGGALLAYMILSR